MLTQNRRISVIEKVAMHWPFTAKKSMLQKLMGSRAATHGAGGGALGAALGGLAGGAKGAGVGALGGGSIGALVGALRTRSKNKASKAAHAALWGGRKQAVEDFFKEHGTKVGLGAGGLTLGMLLASRHGALRELKRERSSK